MYVNPSARKWRCSSDIDPAVLSLHKKLPHYAPTPLRSLCSERLPIRNIAFKDESIRFGLPAFKILGASWATYRAISALLDLAPDIELETLRETISREKKRIVLHAATDGNFGRAVARMATLLGCQASIYVPIIMVEDTKRLIAGEGAEVVVVPGNYDAAVRAADQAARSTDGVLIQDDAWPGYEHIPSLVVEGYSTMMTEIDCQVREQFGKDPEVIVVPVGVGSLAQATVKHYKHKVPSPWIVAVEPETAACLHTSLKNGEQTTVDTGDTMMCGMNCGTVSSLAWPILREGVDMSITVAESDAQDATDILMDVGIKSGPCSAGTLAGLIKAFEVGSEHFSLDQTAMVVVLGTEGPR